MAGKRRFIIETSSSRPPLVQKSACIAQALVALPNRFTADEACRCWDGVIDGEAQVDLFEALVEEAVIIEADNVDPVVERCDVWAAYGWGEAASFHEATRDYPFVKMDAPGAFDIDRDRMKTYVQEARPPEIYQTVEAKYSIVLPSRISPGTSANQLLAAMTRDERRGLPGLGLFFDVCFGERRKEPFDVQGEFLRKSIPSGGARHPTEIYFASFEGAPIPPGSYHYNVEHHRLDCVSVGDHSKQLRHATFDLFQKFDRHPFGLIAFTSLVERAMWRYRDARSSRAVLIDIGHALMIYRTVAQAIGFDTYTYQKVRDSLLCEAMGIDRLRQPALFVGTLV